MSAAFGRTAEELEDQWGSGMKILFLNGVRNGDQIEFALPEITIGREDGNVLRIPVPGVSRYHARLWLDAAGRWNVSDQGSTNGVKLNGVRFSGSRELQENDVLELGDQKIRVSALDEEPPKVIFKPIPTVAGVPGVENVTEVAPAAAPGAAVTPTKEPVFSVFSELEAAGPKTESGQALASALKSGGRSLFGKTQEPENKANAVEASGGRRHSRLLFPILLGALVVVAVTVVVKWLPGTAGGGAAPSMAPVLPPLTVMYEKTVLAADNVFRFAMLLEPEAVTFTIDDIQAQRHYERRFEPVNVRELDILRARITSSGIWQLRQPEAPRTEQLIKRRLLLAEAPKVAEFQVAGEYAPEAFEAVERAITGFAESYGLQTISLPPEELRKQAEDSFALAEDLFANREARLENLRRAIQRYRQVVNYLEQISPPPPMWDKARRRLAEAEDLRKKKLENLEYERVRLGGLRDFAGMRQVFLQITELADPESPEYATARQRLFKLDRFLQEQGR